MNFFSKILAHNPPSHKASKRRRKTIFFVLLFVVVLFSFLGIKIEIAKADATNDCITNHCTTVTGIVNNYDECRKNCIANPNGGGQGAVGSPAKTACDITKTWCCLQPGESWAVPAGTQGGNVCITEQPIDGIGSLELGSGNFLQSILIALGRMLLWGTWLIVGYSSYLLDYVLFKILNSPITTDPRFAGPWANVRDLANMVIVLGFIVVGIATALRLREYEAKKLLWPLVLVALLVNFSGLFCGLIIDASKITTTGLPGGGGVAMAEQMLFSIEGPMKGNVAGVTAAQPWAPGMNGDGLQQGAGPLSWNVAKFAPWSFAGNCAMFSAVFLGMAFTFLYLSAIIIARYVILIILFVLSPLAFAFWVFPMSKKLWTEWWGAFLKWSFVGVFGAFVLWLATNFIISADYSSLATTVISIVVVLGFLYVGFKMTSKSTGLAAMAGSAVMGLATGGAGFVAGRLAGGIKGAAKVTDKLTGGRASNMLNRASAGVDKTMKKYGLRKEAPEDAAKASSDKLADVASGKERFTTAESRATATEQLAKRGHLEKIGGTPAQTKAVNDAQKHFQTMGTHSDVKKDALKQNPDVGTPEEARKAVQGMSGKEVAHLKSYSSATLESMDTIQKNHIMTKASPDDRNRFIAAAQTHHAGLGVGSEKAKDWEEVIKGARRTSEPSTTQPQPGTGGRPYTVTGRK